jgi:proline racemase
MVAAILTPPVNPGSTAGVIFCNNVGYLGMCGHGAMGVVETLRHLGMVTPGTIRLDTCVGTVSAELTESGEVGITNVESFRYAKDVSLAPGVEGCPPEVIGDVSYGGNWFFSLHQSPMPVEFKKAKHLSTIGDHIMRVLRIEGISGEGGATIDHIEFCGPPKNPGANSKNFVLCPGGAYDRSPCGTGTSAKLACLVADGEVQLGESYVQESITGSLFRAVAAKGERGIIPIWGRAYITAESKMILSDDDPLRWGIV